MIKLSQDLIDKILEDPKQRQLTAIKLAADFELFIQYTHYAINKVEFIFKPFHRTVIRKLEAIAFQENKKRNLGLCLPVGSGKSLLVEYFIAWTFCRDINLAYLYTSHSRTNIMKLSRECKDMIEHEFLKNLFNLKLKNDEASKTNWSFEGAINRTGLVATTTGSGSTGADSGNPANKGYSGAVILDDPIDAGDISSIVKVDEIIRLYTDKLETRRRTPTTPSIVVMQRLGVNDLIGWIKGENLDRAETEKIKQAEKRMENWDIVEVSALDEEENSFWPERYPKEELLEIRDSNKYKFYAQYQQRPLVNDGTAIYKIDKLQRYKELPHFTKIVESWDTAFKAKTTNDYSACSIWGVCSTAFGDNYYLLYVWRGKVEYPQLKAKYMELRRFNAFVSLIEDKASGQSLIQDLKQAGDTRIEPVKADTDKISRSTAPSSMIDRGCVFIPEQAPWLSDFIDELVTFPQGKHDDQVDTMNQALNYLNKPRATTIGFNL